MFFNFQKLRCLGFTITLFLVSLSAQSLSPFPIFAQVNSTQNTNGVVNINTATQEELERLPGIGSAKALAIIEQRTRRPFRRITDLLRVSGIGRRTLQRLTPFLTLEGPTTLPARHR